MEIRQLTYFVAIADTLHFSRAAEALGLAPSALSMQLQRLERELGVRLVDRTKRSVSLTSAGKLFLAEARTALGQIEHAKRVASRAGRGEAGVIRIGYVISASCCGIVQDVLARFRALAPLVSIVLEEVSSPAQLQMLEEDKLDVCIVRTLVGTPDQVERIHLRTERIVIAVSSAHPILAQTDIRMRELAGESFIGPHFAQDIGFAAHLSHIGEQIGFVPKIGHHTRDFVTALTLVSAGLGIAAVPESVRSVAIPGVTFLSFDEIQVRSELTMMLRRHETSPVILTFKRATMQMLAAQPPVAT